MRKFPIGYKIYLSIIGIIVFGLSFYLYNDASHTSSIVMSDISKPAVTVKQVSKFNSLVPGVFILEENSKENEAVAAIFSCVGYDIMMGSFEDYKRLGKDNFILLISEEAAKRLNTVDKEYIAGKIKEGQKIITWGKSPLSESLGITFLNKNNTIKGYTWNDKSDVSISFKDSSSLELFSCKEGSKVLAEDQDKNPVMVSGSFGNGNFIYSGIPLISSRGLSYEHFPFIMEAVTSQFKIIPTIARDDFAFYVDIGYHLEESPAEIAEKVKNYGANQINLSAWYSPVENRDTYREIIEECHKRGISVFAWFELPFVSIEFWDEHPEWREKTASGKDAHIDWRRLMALSDPEALEEIKKNTGHMIRSFDWDGVDIAEIYFESPGEGFEEKDKFTPMNDSFRRSFQKKYGIDPQKAFNPFSIYYWKYNQELKQNIVDYRVELITKLHEEFLMLCEDIKKEKPYLKTSVTVIDSIADKRMREDIGVDAESIAKLQNKYHFMLQIEDPYTLWNLGPNRYRVIGEAYRNIMSAGNDLSIDINVIDRGGEVYPTKKQRGVELYQLINHASKYTDKVILYALATVEKADMALVPYTASDDVDVQEISMNEYIIKSEKRFIWNMDTTGKTYYIDGEKWPFVSSQGVIVPGGEHKIEIQDEGNSSNLFIEGINGEISDVFQDDDISFHYNSEGRLYLIVNKVPSKIELDGDVYKPKIMENGNNYTLVLPEGSHEVNLY